MQVSVHSPPLLLFFREHGLLRWWMQQIFMRTVPRVTSLRTGHAWRYEASVHCAEHYWTSFIIVGVNVGVALRRVELTPTVMNEALQCSTEDTIGIYSCPFMLYCGGPSGLCQASLLVFFPQTVTGTPRIPMTGYWPGSQKISFCHWQAGRSHRW